MRKVLLVGVLLLAGVQALQAAEEFTDEVPLELVQMLLGNGVNTRIFAGLPEDFPIQEFPDDVEVLGALEQGNSLRLVLRSSGSFNRLLVGLTRDLLDKGWQTIPMPRPVIPNQGGFVTSGATPSNLCHDQLGNLNINQQGMQSGSGTLIQIYFNKQQGNINFCQQRIESMQRSLGGRMLNGQMPSLALPDSLVLAGGILSPQGSSSSGTSSTSRANLSIDLPLDEIISAFATVIEEQGWEKEVENVGSLAASSIWLKNIEDDEGEDLPLVGILSIVAGDEEYSYQLEFQLTGRAGAMNPGARGFIGAQPFFQSR